MKRMIMHLILTSEEMRFLKVVYSFCVSQAVEFINYLSYNTHLLNEPYTVYNSCNAIIYKFTRHQSNRKVFI